MLTMSTIDGESYTFISYYAPNKGQDIFFEDMLLILRPLFKGTVVLGGDSNLSFDPFLDKSSTKKSIARRPPRQSLKIAQQLNAVGLIDI